MTSEEQARERSKAIWDRMAAGWDEQGDVLSPVAGPVGEWMIDRLAPEPGQTILELAAGPGETRFLAAERVGPDGRLISTDFAPAMVETARRLASSRGVTNVEFREMDAEQMSLDDDSVDGVLCRWGYMLMLNRPAAFAETRRVLRGGGRLALSVLGPPERNPWGAVGAGVLVERGVMPPPDPVGPGLFALADPDRLAALITGAGFDAPELEQQSYTIEFASFEAYWIFLYDLAGAISIFLQAVPSEEAAGLQQALREAISPFASGDGYAFPIAVLNAVAS